VHRGARRASIDVWHQPLGRRGRECLEAFDTTDGESAQQETAVDI